jgi:hypothetical protein
MTRIVWLGFGVLPLLAATPAFAQAPAAYGMESTPEVLAGQAPESTPLPPTLFSFDGVPVQIWTPVAPPYDPNADRNIHGDPSWNGVE